MFSNAGGELCGGDLTAVLTVSCNTGTAQLANRVGRQSYLHIIAELHLTSPANISGVSADAGTIGLSASDSSAQATAQSSDALLVPSDLAETAIGQASVRLTPVSVATLTADILTGRSDVQPYVAAVACAGTTPIGAVSPARSGHPLPGAAADWPGLAAALQVGTAKELRRFTARAASLLVGAKTGTAQLPNGDQIGWIAAGVRYAASGATHKAVVIAMVLPDTATPDPSGGVNAADIAAPVLVAAAAHPPSRALLDAGVNPAAAATVCRAAEQTRPS